MYFKRVHRFENSTKYRADDLCINLVCEYFCWMLGDPHFFFGRSLPFLILSIIQKPLNLYVGSFKYFSCTIDIGRIGTWIQVCMTLKLHFFKANSTWFNDICSKDPSNRPIYAVLNTHNLDMILQLKYMLIVKSWPESPWVTGNPRIARVGRTCHLSDWQEMRQPPEYWQYCQPPRA